MTTPLRRDRGGKERARRRIGGNLDKALFSYAAAASAAGVGILAMAMPAEASVVFTKANATISPNTTLPLDLNNDGVIDFTIIDTFHIGGVLNTGSSFVQHGLLSVQHAQPSDQVAGNGLGSALDFAAKKQIGSLNRFGTYSPNRMEGCFTPPDSSNPIFSGPWHDVTNRFLGLKFSINGEVHYGWARLSTTHSFCRITATLTGYAYETVPNKRIVTGQRPGSAEASVSESAPVQKTAALGLLAKGASGVVAWRKE